MRVAIVISGLGFGGAERQVVLLARELVRQGHPVLIYTLNAEVPRRAELDGSGVELVVDQKRWRLDPLLLSRLRRTLRRWQADVVHGFLYDGELYSALAGVGLGLPVISSERNDNYEVRLVKRLGHRLTSRIKHTLIANSHAGARFGAALRGLDPQHAHVVWNGIDLAEADARLATSNAPAHALWPQPGVRRVCMIGSIKPPKDHALALRVAELLHGRDATWRFLFVGDALVDDGSAYKHDVLEVARAQGAEAYAKFTGNRNDVLELIGSCDVTLVTSRYEGFPNVVLESMACGTPVASTDYSDVRRILPLPWQVADTREPAELAAIVERCVAERDTVSTAQRRWVEQHATVERAARRLIDVYARYSTQSAPRVGDVAQADR